MCLFVATGILYKQATYICAIFLHWMGHLVTLVPTTLPGKKAFLAHVEVEAFETSVSEYEIVFLLFIRNGFENT